MRMQVTEQGDEVLIELLGVAGRHQRILQALTDGHIVLGQANSNSPISAADVSVRAGADDMHIRLKAHPGKAFEALSIYHYLRHALIEHVGEAAAPGAAAA